MDERETAALDLRDVETELCRLPDVGAARIVADGIGRPLEVHILAGTAKHAKQVVRDVQSVAMASFGLELDRRIVSVVQLGPNGAEAAPANSRTPARLSIAGIQAQTTGACLTVQVTLTRHGDDVVGVAEGSAATAIRHRLVAAATLEALRQHEPTAESLALDFAQVTRAGTSDVMLVTLACFDPPVEHTLAGSAIVHGGTDDAVVRAVLDATNRHLPHVDGKHGEG